MSSVNHRLALGALVIGTAACSDAPTLPTHAQRPTAPNAALGPKSPDGKIVYAINAVDGVQVMAYDLVARSTKQLTEYNSLHPNVSADGKRVVVAGPNLTGLGGYNLWTMNIDGTKRDTVSSAALEALSGPTFSPDGKRIVFTAKDAVTSVDHLYTIDIKTRVITPLGNPNASA
jgi:Tol biopolymer transport system component